VEYFGEGSGVVEVLELGLSNQLYPERILQGTTDFCQDLVIPPKDSGSQTMITVENPPGVMVAPFRNSDIDFDSVIPPVSDQKSDPLDVFLSKAPGCLVGRQEKSLIESSLNLLFTDWGIAFPDVIEKRAVRNQPSNGDVNDHSSVFRFELDDPQGETRGRVKRACFGHRSVLSEVSSSEGSAKRTYLSHLLRLLSEKSLAQSDIQEFFPP